MGGAKTTKVGVISIIIDSEKPKTRKTRGIYLYYTGARYRETRTESENTFVRSRALENRIIKLLATNMRRCSLTALISL